MSPTRPPRPHATRSSAAHPSAWARIDSALYPALGVLLLVSVLAIGSVHRVTQLSLGAAAMVLGALATELDRRSRQRPALLTVLLLAMSLASLVQLVPLPSAWVELLTPRGVALYRAREVLVGVPPSGWLPLSLDPGASLLDAVRWSAGAGLFATAHRLGRRHGSRKVSRIVFAVALAILAVTALHALFGLDKVYGLYAPRWINTNWARGPLLNSNNLAGLMNLGACIGLGLLAAQTSLSRRLGLAMAVALLLAASIACASRAAMGALALGLLVLVPWLSVVRRHHRSQWSWPHFGWGLLPLAFLAPVGLFLRRTNALEGLGQRDLDKLKLIGRAAHVARDYFWTGVGRGAFEAVYGAYAPAPILVRPQWAECFPLDWALGWGVPLTALFLLSAAWGLLPNRLGVSSSPAAKGAWVAALVLGAHNLLDMGLEVPAILWNVTALLGGLVGASTLREHRRSTRRPSVATRPPPSRLGALLPATLTLCTLWPMIGAVHSWRPARDEAEALGASLPRPDAEPQTERWWAELRAALLRHPADPDLPLLAAIADAQRPTGHPLRYLNAAIVAEPASGRPYFVLGNILYDHGALDQAIGALCKGIEQQPDILSRAAKLLAARNYDAALLVRAAPRTSAAAQLLGALAQQLPDSDDRKASLLRAAFDRAPSEPRTQRMLLEIRLAQLEHRSAVCEQAARSACLEDVAALLAQAPAEDFPEARARLLLLQDHPQAAWDLLDSRCATTRDPLGCLRVRLMAAVSLGEERAQLAAEDYVNQACRFDEGCSRASAWAGAVLRDHALPRLALPYLTRAAELQGTEAAWTVVAELANALGDTGQYLAAQRHAQSVHRVTH